MARGINKVILIGNLGQDPDIRYTQSGAPVANLSLATAESWRDRETGEQNERTEWHRLVMFGRTAEVAQQYLKKGSQIFVEGRLQTRKWQDRDGNERYTTEVVVNDMQMLGGRGGEGGGISGGGMRGDDNYSGQGGGAPAPQRKAPAAPAGGGDDGPLGGDGGFEDDIPF